MSELARKISRAKWENQEITVEQNSGNTPVKSLVDKHVDIISLDIHKLVSVAKLISESVSEDKTVRFTKKTVTNIVMKAVKEDLLDLDCLPDRIQKEVLKMMKKEG